MIQISDSSFMIPVTISSLVIAQIGTGKKRTIDMRIWILFAALIMLLFACTIPEEPDVDPPIIALLYPTDGQRLTGVVPVSIVAGDNREVKKVEFYVDGILVKEWTERPYTFSWDVSSLADDEVHQLSAAAYDKAENIGVTPTIGVVLTTGSSVSTDNTPPVIQLVYPSDGSQVTDSVRVVFSVQDNVGIDRVELYRNGVQIATANNSPYTFEVNLTGEEYGSTHTFFGIAVDRAGNQTVSNSVTVARVQQITDNVPPVSTILYPTSGSAVDGNVIFYIDARDENGVKSVQLFMDGNLIATDLTAPYEIPWNSEQVLYGSFHSFFARVTDNYNNVGYSQVITLVRDSSSSYQQDIVAPVVTILTPVGTEPLSGTVSVRVDVVDNVGVSKVEFYIDGELKLMDTQAPWEYSFETTGMNPNQTHSIYIKGYDFAGNIGIAFRTFTIQ